MCSASNLVISPNNAISMSEASVKLPLAREPNKTAFSIFGCFFSVVMIAAVFETPGIWFALSAKARNAFLKEEQILFLKLRIVESLQFRDDFSEGLKIVSVR